MQDPNSRKIVPAFVEILLLVITVDGQTNTVDPLTTVFTFTRGARLRGNGKYVVLLEVAGNQKYTGIIRE